jgi:hypothetical protein
MENTIFITRSVILFFCYLQKVLLLRLGLFSIVYPIFFQKKIMLFYLFIFAVTVKYILTCGISLDSKK